MVGRRRDGSVDVAPAKGPFRRLRAHMPKTKRPNPQTRIRSSTMSRDITVWAEKDSNLRRRCRLIYSQLPLATRASTQAARRYPVRSSIATLPDGARRRLKPVRVRQERAYPSIGHASAAVGSERVDTGNLLHLESHTLEHLGHCRLGEEPQVSHVQHFHVLIVPATRDEADWQSATSGIEFCGRNSAISLRAL